jgi:hypothetical protein
MKQSSHRKRNFFELLFSPDFDELALFSMSYVCFLLFIINSPPQTWSLDKISIQIEDFWLIILCLLFLTGMILSFYHAFSDRNKSLIEKKIMLLFAVLLIGFSGIWGGTYMFLHSSGWLTAFPIWNIVSGWILIVGLRAGSVNEENISDDNVELTQIISSAIVVGLIFFGCYIWLELNWAATLSICIAWVTTLNNTVSTVIFRGKAIIRFAIK